jgi:hypothetical protein
MRESGRHGRGARLRVVVAGLIAAMAVTLLASCGDEDSSGEEPDKPPVYHVKLTESLIPVNWRVGETYRMFLGFRNAGKNTVPNLAVTVTILGKAGRASSLPFGIHDPTPGVAQPDRPVWVLEAGYPKLQGSKGPGGASTSNPKTFAFGPLKPGQGKKMEWKLTAVRPGDYGIRYEGAGDIDGESKTYTYDKIPPGGEFGVTIKTALPNTEVTDSGEVVEKRE